MTVIKDLSLTNNIYKSRVKLLLESLDYGDQTIVSCHKVKRNLMETTIHLKAINYLSCTIVSVGNNENEK